MATPLDDFLEDCPDALAGLHRRRPLRSLLGRWFDWRMSRGAIGTFLFIALAAFLGLSQLDELLKLRHPAGAAGYGMGDLANLLHPSLDRGKVVLVDTWLKEAPEGFTGPSWIALSHILVDTFLYAPFYCGLLAIALLRVGLAIRQAAEDPILRQRLAERRLARRGALVTDDATTKEMAALPNLVLVYRKLICAAFVGTAMLLVVDVLENVCQGLVLLEARGHIPGSGAVYYVALYAFSATKWALFWGVAAALAIGLLALEMFHRTKSRSLVSALVVLRAPIFLMAFYGLGFLLGATPFAEQALDVIRTWHSDRSDAVVAIVLTGWLAFLTLVLARRLLEPVGGIRTKVWLGWPLLTGLGLILLWLGLRHEHGGAGLAVAGAILLGVAILSRLTGQVAEEPLPPLTVGLDVLPAILAAAPLVVLGLTVQKASLAEFAYKQHWWYVIWVGVGLLLQLAGWLVFVRARKPSQVASKDSTRDTWLLWASVLVSIYLFARILLNPWSAALALGGIGLFAAFMVAASLVAYGLMWAEERRQPPSAFLILRLRRIPVFGLIVLWSVIAAVLDKGGYHDVRRLYDVEYQSAQAEKPGLTVAQAFERWRKNRELPESPAATTGVLGAKPAVPLVLAAAEGGGIRAAYWTAIALDCLLEGGIERSCGPEAPAREGAPLFAAAGASGGSLGLVAYSSHLREQKDDPEDKWVDRLGEDALTPMFGWMLYVDLPNSVLKFDSFQDRAEVLERTWEQAWEGKDDSLWSFLLPWRKGPPSGGPLADGFWQASLEPQMPLLILSGTTVEEACRFNTSILDVNVAASRLGTQIEDCLTLQRFERGHGTYLAPETRRELGFAFAATKDLDDFLCDEEDVRLSTAALLSARFPFASPSGRVVKCNDAGDTATYVVDGGYYDNTGVSPLLELWAALEPVVDDYNRAAPVCVAPFFLQVDNHYSAPPGPEPDPRPKELEVPLKTAGRVRAAHDANARQAAGITFQQPFGGYERVTDQTGREVDRYAHIYPRAHPGTQAPLGWSLSKAATDDMKNELGGRDNEAEIRKVRDWFGQPLVCDPRTG